MNSRIQTNWDNLQYFLEVARQGNLSAAAARLGVDHTTVGRRILSLEADFETILFRRTPRGYMLTPTGSKLVEFAEAIEEKVVNAKARVAGRNLELSGTIRVGATEGFGTTFLAPIIPRFSAQNPGLEIEIISLAGFVSLSRREAHMAITYSRPTSGRLVARKLVDYDFCLFASSDYLGSKPPIEGTDDFREHDFIGYVGDLIYAPELRFIHRIVSPERVKHRSNSILVQAEMAIQGAGIVPLPCFVAAGRPELIPVLPNLVSLRRELWLTLHSDLQELERFRLFRNFIVDEVEAAKADFINPLRGGSSSQA